LFWGILDFDFKWKLEDLKNKFLELFWIGKKATEDKLNLEKLKSFFEKNTTNLSVDIIDGKDFFEVFYIDKNNSSKVKGIIPFK